MKSQVTHKIATVL